ncbi:MAG: F0F1 ATP synthase subunit beta, partial [Anaerolineae bacterium]|nr:F0F1 ATP synthase subunit beta [Anaerolineae bacterium]
MVDKSNATKQANQGKIRSIRGSVIDVCFPEPLPELYSELRTGDGGRVVIETVTHLSAKTVRGIALTPTQGLARGDRVTATGHPLEVPVGERLLG